MKSLRLPCSLAILTIVFVSAQSNLLAHFDQASAIPDTQRRLSQTAVHLAPAAQAPELRFAKAVTYGAGGYGATSMAVADVNGDGYPDLAVLTECGDSQCDTGGDIGVLLGSGDGTFQSPLVDSSGGWIPLSVAIADVNGDGHPDLIVANECQDKSDCSNGNVAVLLGNGDGTFQAPVSYNSGGYFAYSVAIGDVNGDGIPDLVVSNICQSSGSCDDGSVSVLWGNGNGTFQAAISYGTGGMAAASVAISDVNGDGYPDIVVANECATSSDCHGAASVLLNHGDGRFQPPISYSSGGYDAVSIAVGDVNGDGHLDLVVANACESIPCHSNGGVGILLGNGDGTFQSAVTYKSGGFFSASVVVGDVNGDGYLDLIVAGCHGIGDECGGTNPGEVGVLVGNGDGTFQKVVKYSSGGDYTSSVAIADVRGIGKLDLLVSNQCQSASSCYGDAGVLLNSLSYDTTTVVASSMNPSQVNQTVNFTATVTSTRAIPDGSTVTFYNDKIGLGTGTTTNGMATFATSFSNAKAYSIKASYPGDAFHKSSSATVKQVVQP